MKEVKRYKTQVGMLEFEYGAWVRYADYKELANKLEAVREYCEVNDMANECDDILEIIGGE